VVTRDTMKREDREAVIRRDGACLMFLFDQHHICRDTWGRSHGPRALEKLTIEHVHEGYGLMGRRAPSDRMHMVALCHAANVGVPSKEARAFFRGYLATVNL